MSNFMIDYSDAPNFGRVNGLKKSFEFLSENISSDFNIVETGTSRGSLGGGVEGDGWATLLFGWVCKKHGGKVTTIDYEAEAIENCKELTKDYSEFIDYIVGDSVAALEKYNDEIDLLYLDSGNDPELCLRECKAAYSKVKAETIIIMDDTSYSTKRIGGVNKGILTIKYLYDRGWELVYDDGDQVIMKNCKSKRKGLINSIKSFLMDSHVKKVHKRAIRKNAI